MTGRATTPEQKRAIVERVLAAWIMKPELRLGQLLDVAHACCSPLFYVEDEALATHVKEMAEALAAPKVPA